MSDLTIPLQWDSEPQGSPSSTGSTAVGGLFRWPSPPYASYPDAQVQNKPMDCEIVGVNQNKSTGRLMMMLPEKGMAHVQVPPARTTIPLHFTQFRSMTLLQPLHPDHSTASDDPHAGMLMARPVTEYRLQLAGGGELVGPTIGHVVSDHGLFLFPPVGDDGSVRRMFVPKSAFSHMEIGPRIGEVLVEQSAATPKQVEHAAQMQQAMRSRKLGDILVTRQVLTPEQLVSALDKQACMPMVKIGEALTTLGIITDAQLKEALGQQAQDRSVPLGELLVSMRMVSREDLQTALARKMGYPVVDVANFPVEAEAVRKLPFAAASRLNAVPLLMRGGRLIVAIEDPSARAALDEIEFISQVKVVPVLARVGTIALSLPPIYERLGNDVWSSRSPLDPTAPIEFELNDAGKLVESLERQHEERVDDEKPIEQSDNSLVRLVNTMVIEAHSQGVSDIHIEAQPGNEKVRIRFRKDGHLRPYLELPHTYRSALVARIKIMCDLDISEKRKPQDGKINFAKFSPGHKLELRVATIPTNHGLEDVVMRLLASARPIAIDQLGLSPANLASLKQAIERPYGLVLCVGPTGSGKTTTLHSALGHINTPERKIWTAEDPVEITQPGLRQVQVNPKIDWTFAKALRAFLRADPDVIMVGEIRDEETAQTAVEASLTGHLVLSTLHTNSAAETITRLLDMGMDPFNFGDSLLAVVAQRLVRRLCQHCRVGEPADDAFLEELLADHLHVYPALAAPTRDAVLNEWISRFGHQGRLMRYRCRGCDQCEQTGFRGRAGVHELLTVSRDLRRLIQTGARMEEIQHTALSEGMHTLRQDGIEKVLLGLTTIEEVRATSNT